MRNRRRRRVHVLDVWRQCAGHFIRVREGDIVEFHLSNHPTKDAAQHRSARGHGTRRRRGVDLHRAGAHSQFSFTALNPGLFVYHCATAPVAMHIANGMYGLILVEPKEGCRRSTRSST